MMKYPANNKGVALVITLWALVFLAVIAAAFTFAVRMGNASARNFKEDTKAYYLAVSAYEEAIAWLLTDKDLTVDFVDEEGTLHTDEEREPITGEHQLEDATVKLQITDEESRLNINSINPIVLKNLLINVGIPEDYHQELMDSLMDWLDSDDLHHLMGAEDEYYGPLGYRAKNAVLDVPEELLLIKGFTPEILYGTDESSPLLDYITTWSSGLNINTISASTMEILGMNPAEVDTILSGRRNGLLARGVPQGVSRIGGRISSTTFRIVATAKLKESPMAVKITAVVRRNQNLQGPGPGITTLYWKEEVEHSRA